MLWSIFVFGNVLHLSTSFTALNDICRVQLEYVCMHLEYLEYEVCGICNRGHCTGEGKLVGSSLHAFLRKLWCIHAHSRCTVRSKNDSTSKNLRKPEPRTLSNFIALGHMNLKPVKLSLPMWHEIIWVAVIIWTHSDLGFYKLMLGLSKLKLLGY